MKTEFNKRAGSTTTAQKVVYQSDVTPTTDGNYILAANDVKANLAALDSAIHTGGSGSVVTVTTAQTPETGYLTTYVISQGGTEKGKINIPKDFLVKSAEMGTVTAQDKASGGKFENDDDYSVGDKYIDFVLNTADTDQGTGTAKHVYINVKSLVDTYTPASGATQVQLAISAGNEISATLVNNAVDTAQLKDNAVTTDKILNANVTKAKLDSSVQTSLGKADTALQSNSIAEGATNGTIAVGGTDVAVHGLGSAAYTDSTAYATSDHVHGNISNDGKVGTTADLAVVTGTGGAVTTADLTTAAPTTGSATDAVEFITSVSQGSNGKISATKEAVRNASATQSGLMSSSDYTKLSGFGNASTYKTKQTAITTDPTASGTASEVVTSVLQNANGEITVTRANLPAAVKPNWNAAAGDAAEILNKPLLDGTYDQTTNKIATQSTVTNAINALDVPAKGTGAITGMGAGKTIATLTESDGKVAATFQDIQIAENQVTNLTTDLAAKVDKVSGATADHIATFVSGGGIQDSGKVVGDFATAAQGTLAASAVQSVSGDSGVTVSTSNHAVTVAAKVDGSTIEVSNDSSKNLQVKDGGIGTDKLAASAVTTAKIADANVTTAKLANLTSFKLVDTANDGGAFQGQVYQITIDHGVLTVTPVAS